MIPQRRFGFSLGLVMALAIVCISVFPSSAKATNVVLNPSFEIGAASLVGCPAGLIGTCSAEGNVFGNCCNPDSTTIPDWTISAFTQAAGVFVPAAGNALLPLPDGSTAVAYTSGGSLSQTLGATVVDGDTYTLTAWIAPSYNQFVQSASEFIGLGGFGSGSEVASATGSTSGAWTQVSVTWVAGADASVSGQDPAGKPLTIILFNQGGAGVAYFDDICLTVNGGTCGATNTDAATVPEPGSLFLLGGGILGLAKMARRRRS